MHNLLKLHLERFMHLTRGELCFELSTRRPTVTMLTMVVLLQTPFNLLWKISQCLSNKEGYRNTEFDDQVYSTRFFGGCWLETVVSQTQPCGVPINQVRK
jgi:hypothetical protein